jgi:hypothetical protein
MTSSVLSWGILGIFGLAVVSLVFTRNFAGLLILFGATLGLVAPFFALNGLTVPAERLFPMVTALFSSMFGVMTLVAVGIWQTKKIEELTRLTKPSEGPTL